MNWKIFSGWICILMLPLLWMGYSRNGEFSSRWGTLHGNEALVALIGFSVLCLFMGYGAIKETMKLMRDRKK